MSETKHVLIERGRYSSYFQVARAWLTAASARAVSSPHEAIAFLDAAIKELRELRAMIVRSAS